MEIVQSYTLIANISLWYLILKKYENASSLKLVCVITKKKSSTAGKYHLKFAKALETMNMQT